jgi:hypothetical protein
MDGQMEIGGGVAGLDIVEKSKSKATSKAADRSVRPTQDKIEG